VNIGDQPLPVGIRLQVNRDRPGIHDQPVYLDEPEHGVLLEHARPLERGREDLHLQQIPHLLGLAAHGALGDTERGTQLVRSAVRLLRGVEQEVDLPDGIDDRPRPRAATAAGQRRRALAGQLRHCLPRQLGVFRVQQVGADGIGDLDDLLGDRPHCLRDIQLVKVSHGRILAYAPMGRDGTAWIAFFM
jgi:hypothetical protein